ncbi:EAL and HDOD domain-containing protein [Saccharospirillum mangrovi]|uniref:EAL and HDOD domain-containing protein n=1 Tax=Saccharospirillum mangrovi TaxID=2161747 RepID=UPI000D382260|nr:HDOD domain-containing protein [Saccharospirillum mangrovi]
MSEEVLFARQPIFDRGLQVFGYELLFRQGGLEQAVFEDGDLATRSVMLNAYTHSNIEQALNQKPGLLNVTKTMLNALPDFLRHTLIIEVLEDYHSDDDLIAILAHLRERGFRLALDDFEHKDYRPALIDIVDLVKIDVLATGRDDIQKLVNTLRSHAVKLVAEKVETYDDFQFCLELGFDYFQGYFFCQPEAVHGRRLQPGRINLLKLLADLYRPDISVNDIYRHVQQDTVLSYKLLQLVNSSFYRRGQHVDSIHQAVALLGIDRIRGWATLINMDRFDNKPRELQREALTRAFFCEQLGQRLAPDQSDCFFTVGLLSILDALMDQTMTEVVQELPLSADIKAALSESAGLPGRTLAFAIRYAQAKPLDDALLRDFQLSAAELSAWYQASIERADGMLGQ